MGPAKSVTVGGASLLKVSVVVECDSDRERGRLRTSFVNGPLPEAGGLAGHLGAAVVVGHLVVVEQGVAAPAKIIHSY